MTSVYTPGMSGPAAVDRKVVAMSVTRGKIGQTKKLKCGEFDTGDTDAEWIGATKRLFNKKAMTDITCIDGRIDKILETVCVPSMMRRGVYLVPIEKLEWVEAELSRLKAEREQAVNAFLSAYGDYIEEARLKLNGRFRPEDYTNARVVARKFYFEWQIISMGVPGSLSDISADLFRREQAKAERAWEAALAEVRQLLRVSMKEFVDKLVERLTPDQYGQAKEFKPSTVENLREFVENFSFRNITDDALLTEQISRAKSLLSGVDADLLRDAYTLRESVRRGFEQISASVDVMVQDAPDRLIDI